MGPWCTIREKPHDPFVIKTIHFNSKHDMTATPTAPWAVSEALVHMYVTAAIETAEQKKA